MSNATSLANGSQPEALGFIPVHIDLPPEIRYNIVGSIQYNSGYSNPYLTLDLLSCCIASKQWRDVAVPFLAKSFETLDFCDWLDDDLVLKLVQRISQLLDVSPQTLMYCVTVELSFSVPPYTDTDGIMHTRDFDEAVIDVIRMLPGLKTIQISMVDGDIDRLLTDKVMENIFQYLARIQAVAHNKVTELIVFERCQLAWTFLLFQPIFVKMPKLRKVQLNGLSDVELVVLKDISQGSPHIEILELSLRTGGDIPLEDFVGSWSGLRVLRVDRDETDYETDYESNPDYITKTLLNELADNCHKLEEFTAPQKFLEEEMVNLDQPRVWREWENSLHNMILCCPNIRRLDLTNRGISDITLTALVTQIPLLENLNLRCCTHLTGSSLLAIDTTSWVQINLPHLQFLDLRGCQLLNPAAIQHLASSAPSLKVLKLPSSLNNHAGLAAHFETALNLLQHEDENPWVKIRWWVKPHVAEEWRKNAGQRQKRAEGGEKEDGDSIFKLHKSHRFD